MIKTKVSFLAVVLFAVPAIAQQSANFKLSEHVLNAGGHPADGVVLASASFRITLDAVGEPVAQLGLSSPSFRMEGGFPSAYPPPGEVRGLGFTDEETLFWNPERSRGSYNLYRDLVGDLSGLGYGTCESDDLPGETTVDSDEPPIGESYFYLVTAENLLSEEGTKGSDSGGAGRPNDDPCP